jgi:hypothetical protein
MPDIEIRRIMVPKPVTIDIPHPMPFASFLRKRCSQNLDWSMRSFRVLWYLLDEKEKAHIAAAIRSTCQDSRHPDQLFCATLITGQKWTDKEWTKVLPFILVESDRIALAIQHCEHTTLRWVNEDGWVYIYGTSTRLDEPDDERPAFDMAEDLKPGSREFLDDLKNRMERNNE